MSKLSKIWPVGDPLSCFFFLALAYFGAPQDATHPSLDKKNTFFPSTFPSIFSLIQIRADAQLELTDSVWKRAAFTPSPCLCPLTSPSVGTCRPYSHFASCPNNML